MRDGGRPPSSAAAGRSRSGRGRWSQLFPRVCRLPRTWPGHSSTRDHLGRISSWRRRLPGWDAEECKLGCCSSPAHRGESSKRRFYSVPVKKFCGVFAEARQQFSQFSWGCVIDAEFVDPCRGLHRIRLVLLRSGPKGCRKQCCRRKRLE